MPAVAGATVITMALSVSGVVLLMLGVVVIVTVVMYRKRSNTVAVPMPSGLK